MTLQPTGCRVKCVPQNERKEKSMKFKSIYRAGVDRFVFFEETNEEDRASHVDYVIYVWQRIGVALVATEPAYGVTGCEDTARKWREEKGDFFTLNLEGGRYTDFTLVIDKAIFLTEKWGFNSIVREAKELIAILNSDCVTAYEAHRLMLQSFISEHFGNWWEVITPSDVLDAGGSCMLFGGLSGTEREVPEVLERMGLGAGWEVRPFA